MLRQRWLDRQVVCAPNKQFLALAPRFDEFWSCPDFADNRIHAGDTCRHDAAVLT